MERKEMARQSRSVMQFVAISAPDRVAATIPALYPVWRAEERVEPGDRRYYPTTGKLYKVREGQGHVTQEDWPPDVATSLWEVLDVEHAGTLEDPIPAASNMAYISGKYYSEGGVLYRCIRDVEQPISHMPSELVDIYFEVVA